MKEVSAAGSIAKRRKKVAKKEEAYLRHADILHSALGTNLINLQRSRKDKQSSLLNLHAALRNTSDDGALLEEEFAECLADGIGDAHNHEVESSVGNSDGSHAVSQTKSLDQSQ